jgi:N-acetylmuramoyl-L-alanine amidase
MAQPQQEQKRRRGLLFHASLLLLLVAHAASAQRLSLLAPQPDWSQLDPFQQTITRERFTELLMNIYAPAGAADPYIRIQPDSAVIEKTVTPPTYYTLRFAPDMQSAKPPPRYWRPALALPPSVSDDKPLQGVKIALDPGHIGGAWAKMEERWFQIGNSKPVAEGDMTLLTAGLLATKLRALGAETSFVRDSAEPLTKARPEDLRKAAADELKRQGLLFIRDNYNGASDPLKQNSIQWESELLFYRISEIRQRAAVVNDKLKPDLTLCLHFNAEPWGDPAHPQLTDANHLHILINGAYGPTELACDDVRETMLLHLLEGCYQEEILIAPDVAQELATATGLPPYTYASPNAKQILPYVWARNLLASRLYRNPVIYIEAYVMNSNAAFARIQMGDYEGTRDIAGVSRKSIYREYADAVAEGLADYYRDARPKK